MIRCIGKQGLTVRTCWAHLLCSAVMLVTNMSQSLAAVLNSLDLLGDTLVPMLQCIFSRTSYICACNNSMPLISSTSCTMSALSRCCKSAVRMVKHDASVCELRYHMQAMRAEPKQAAAMSRATNSQLTSLHCAPPLTPRSSSRCQPVGQYQPRKPGVCGHSVHTQDLCHQACLPLLHLDHICCLDP